MYFEFCTLTPVHFDGAFRLLVPGVGMAGSGPAHPKGLTTCIQSTGVFSAALYRGIHDALGIGMMGGIRSAWSYFGVRISRARASYYFGCVVLLLLLLWGGVRQHRCTSSKLARPNAPSQVLLTSAHCRWTSTPPCTCPWTIPMGKKCGTKPQREERQSEGTTWKSKQ